ncbi:hypothetical protein Sa4125_19810 [Aureimonas sp. SA4125]|nr:hypothetical protein Sa4125_19810 [Aureimonas sp. SA4125]
MDIVGAVPDDDGIGDVCTDLSSAAAMMSGTGFCNTIRDESSTAAAQPADIKHDDTGASRITLGFPRLDAVPQIDPPRRGSRQGKEAQRPALTPVHRLTRVPSSTTRFAGIWK